MIHNCECGELFMPRARVMSALYYPSDDENLRTLVITVILPYHMPDAPEDVAGLLNTPLKVICRGKLADTCALNLSEGKLVHLMVRPFWYEAPIRIESMCLFDENGETYKELRTGYALLKIVFGEDSKATVLKEIMEGYRPKFWYDNDHPDHRAWLEIVSKRNKTKFKHGMTEFGFAKVIYK